MSLEESLVLIRQMRMREKARLKSIQNGFIIRLVLMLLLLLGSSSVVSGSRGSSLISNAHKFGKNESSDAMRNYRKDCPQKRKCARLSPDEAAKMFGDEKRLIPTGPNPLHNR
ncbi:hypothetical protein SUGI_0376380 [Cryptomeria japonica]|nr:hypothetical protein SUGI_0376380 [Cryptomeria japonica]